MPTGTSGGKVLRTETDDEACGHGPDKIGPANDGRPGGCDNIRLVLSDATSLPISVWHEAEPSPDATTG